MGWVAAECAVLLLVRFPGLYCRLWNGLISAECVGSRLGVVIAESTSYVADIAGNV